MSTLSLAFVCALAIAPCFAQGRAESNESDCVGAGTIATNPEFELRIRNLQ